MLKNYFKTTFRRLWRHKLFTFLNIIGLAIGIAASWLIFRIADYELSYDTDLPDIENTYRLITHVRQNATETTYGGISPPIYQAIQDEVTGVERAVPVFVQWHATVEVPKESAAPLVLETREGLVATQKEYFELRPYTWLAGNVNSTFDNPASVVLTQSRAQLYFPSTEPSEVIDKVLVYDGGMQKTVSGVVKDLDSPSEFTAEEFFYLEPKTYHLGAWTGTNGGAKVYLQLYPGSNPELVLQQINQLSEEKWDDFRATLDQPIFVSKKYDLLPMSESHFSTHVLDVEIRKASKPVIYGLIGVGGFLMLLACINYINLSTAQIPKRSKEIGIRKTLGGGKTQLVGQVLGETLATVGLSSVLAIVFSYLGFYFLGDVIPEGIVGYSNGFGFFIFFLSTLGLMTLISGGYPAWMISKLQPAGIIRGPINYSSGRNTFTLRKGLIVFQFAIAQFFIVGALLIGQQLSYTLEKDMGFEKEAVVLVDIPWSVQRDSTFNFKIHAFAEELKKERGIQQVSLGREPLSSGGNTASPFTHVSEDGEAREQQLIEKWVDTSYIHLYQMELLAGRNIRISQQPNEYLINETAAKGYGFQDPEDAVGQLVSPLGKEPFPVVGVVKDFHTKDFYTEMEPVVLMYQPSNFGTVNIRLDSTDPAQWQETLAAVEQKWYFFYPPETYSMRFYDEAVETMYAQERNLAKLINLATGIAILISCLGLFGLASLTTFQRTKEIGIRKVLGAKTVGILALLSKDFVKLVLVAVLIASPVAWWATERWLEDFAYKIDIQWWVFMLAGLFVCTIAVGTVSVQSLKTALSNPVNSLKNE